MPQRGGYTRSNITYAPSSQCCIRTLCSWQAWAATYHKLNVLCFLTIMRIRLIHTRLSAITALPPNNFLQDWCRQIFTISRPRNLKYDHLIPIRIGMLKTVKYFLSLHKKVPGITFGSFDCRTDVSVTGTFCTNRWDAAYLSSKSLKYTKQHCFRIEKIWYMFHPTNKLKSRVLSNIANRYVANLD